MSSGVGQGVARVGQGMAKESQGCLYALFFIFLCGFLSIDLPLTGYFD